MKLCKTCGLPMKICNALAHYRIAIKHFDHGLIDAAWDSANSANEFHDAYMADRQKKAAEV